VQQQGNSTAMMSWSNDGKLVCVGYQLPPTAAAALKVLGYTPPASPLPFCGLSSAQALERTEVTVIRIQEGAGAAQVPVSFVGLFCRSLLRALERAGARAYRGHGHPHSGGWGCGAGDSVGFICRSLL